MISIGRSIRWQNNYFEEVRFSRENGFDFMQIWFQKGSLSVDTLKEPKERAIRDAGFPVILYTVFDLDDFGAYGDRLIELARYFGYKELIVHPVCKAQPITERSGYLLSGHVAALLEKTKPEGIALYIENNSRLDGFHHSKEELAIVFDRNPGAGQLLDVAHIDSYEHLGQIIGVKYPGALHIADRRFDRIHEHLPVGQGDIDF